MTLFLIISFSLTLNDAIERALRESPVYLEAKNNFLIQQKTNSFIYSSLLPQVFGGYNYLRSHTRTQGIELYDTTRAYNVTLDWNLKLTDFLDAYSTHWENSSAYYSFHEAKNGVIFQVITEYLNSLMMRNLLLSKKKAVERTENNLLLIDKKVELGSASRAELLKSKVDNLQARYELIRTRKEERVANLNLKKLIGVKVTDSINLMEPSIEFKLPSKDSIIFKAIENDPTLNMYRAIERSARIDLISTTADQLFTLSFNGNYGYTGEEFPTKDIWSDGDEYSIGISINIPIFTGFSRVNQIMITKLQLSIASVKLRDRERELRILIENNYLGYKESVEKLDLARVTMELAEESYKATEERFRLGEASIIELLGAEEDLLQAQYSETQSLFDYYISIFKLKRIMGRLP